MPALHGPQSGTITGPALPGLPLWMWAARARPERPEKLSFQLSTAPVAFSLYVPLNAPFAVAGAFGAGTSPLDASVALTL